jgi:hypothetical protein
MRKSSYQNIQNSRRGIIDLHPADNQLRDNAQDTRDERACFEGV